MSDLVASACGTGRQHTLTISQRRAVHPPLPPQLDMGGNPGNPNHSLYLAILLKELY